MERKMKGFGICEQAEVGSFYLDFGVHPARAISRVRR
jgi:hypothetical protein